MSVPSGNRRVPPPIIAIVVVRRSSCSLVRVRTVDDSGRTFEEVSPVIAELQHARERSDSPQIWWDLHRASLSYPEPERWDGMLGARDAERSASRVCHNRRESGAETVLAAEGIATEDREAVTCKKCRLAMGESASSTEPEK
jgi:hypothetical protein